MKKINRLKGAVLAFATLLTTSAMSATYTFTGTSITGGSAQVTACVGYTLQVAWNNSAGCGGVNTTIELQRSTTSSTSGFSTVHTMYGSGSGHVDFPWSAVNVTGWYRYRISGSPSGPASCGAYDDAFTTYTWGSSKRVIINPAASALFTLNGDGASTIVGYTCQPINLAWAGTGSLTQHRISVQETDYNGNILSGGYSNVGSWTSGTPSTTDLNVGANATAFATKPYFRVTLETNNGTCTGSRYARILTSNAGPSSTPGFKINNTNVPTACGSPMTLFSCSGYNATLSNTSTSTAVKYNFVIESLDAQCGLPSVVYSSGDLSTFPTDLKNMPGTNGTYLQSNNGFYKITMTVRNVCGTLSGTSQVGYIKVIGAPTGLNANFTTSAVTRINNYVTPAGCTIPTLNTTLKYIPGGSTICGTGGVYQFPMQTSGSTTNNEVGKNYTTFDLSGVTGGTGSLNYSVAITSDRWTGSSWENMNYLNQPEVYYGGIPSIQLRNLLDDDPSNPYYLYFDDAPTNGGIFRVTVTVTNECGSVPQTHVFKMNTTGLKTAAYEGDEDLAEEVSFEADRISTVYPNPATATVSFDVTATENDRISIAVYDIKGNHVMDVINDFSAAEGTNVFNVNTEALNAGMYLYTIKLNNNVYKGKLSKQ